jgi:hypothetical protein
MSDTEYERAVLWVPDPGSPAGWIRRKVWAEEPKRKTKPPMGFNANPGGGRHREPEAPAPVDAERP